MTEKQLRLRIESLKRTAVGMVKQSSPVLTGNLRNSVMVRDIENGGFEIYIDTAQAPYAKYTIDEWESLRLKGRENPNEGWTYEATKEFIQYATNNLKGGK